MLPGHDEAIYTERCTNTDVARVHEFLTRDKGMRPVVQPYGRELGHRDLRGDALLFRRYGCVEIIDHRKFLGAAPKVL